MEARKKLLAEIDCTINQLVENGEILKKISSDPSYEMEASALEKTQESLLAHLMHLHTYLEEKQKTAEIKSAINIKQMFNSPNKNNKNFV